MNLFAVVVAALVLAAPAQAKPRLVKLGTFDKPVYVTAPRGDRHRVFVVEKTGRIRIIKDGRLLPKPFLDISGRVREEAEMGLLSMAFPPGYASRRRVYVFYTDARRPGGDAKITQHVSEFALTSKDVADPDSERRILNLADPDFNNNAGQLQFGPDGALYVSNGDGGGDETGPGDPFHTAQDPDSRFGKLLRIGDDESTSIYASGLRNPWRFSFDRKTGGLIVTDVGQQRQEEVDYLEPAAAGANFGWPTYEGNILRRPDEPIRDAVRPRLVLEHGDGACAITGGYVSRDPRVSSTRGRYLFGDFCDGDIRSVRLSDPSSSPRRTGLHVEALVSFGEDARRRLYAASLAGPVYRISPARDRG